MDILFDIILELHSLLLTRLPDPWTFVKLQLRTDLTVILNNITYFAVYFAFFVWFSKLCISRFETTLGRRLQAMDKYLAAGAVISGVSAIHVLWQFLLFITHFITCSFYPWATTAVVVLLYLYPLTTSLRMLCSNVSSKISDFKEYSKGIFSFEWLITSVSFPTTTEPTTIYPILHRPLPEEDYVRPNATTVISPAISVDEEYRPSDASVMQPRPSPEMPPGPSETPVIQPRPSPEMPPGPSETPVIQPPSTIEKLYRLSDPPKLQPQIIPHESPNASMPPPKPHALSETHTRENHLDREMQTKTTPPEDFSQQVDRERRRIRSSPPGSSMVNLSNPPGVNSLWQPRTTRQGTVYGPPEYFR